MTRRACAGLSAGLAAAGILRFGVDWFGHSPRVVALAAGAGLLGAAGARWPARAPRWARLVGGGVAAGVVAAGPRLASWVWAQFGTDGLVVGAVAAAAAVGWVTSWIAPFPAGRVARVAAAVGALVGLGFGTPPVLVGGSLVLGLALVFFAAPEEPARPAAPASWVVHGGEVAAAVVAAALGLALWAGLRVAVDPTPAGLLAVLGTGIGVASLTRGRVAAAVGLAALAGGAGWLVGTGEIDATLGRLAGFGPGVLAVVGAATALVLGGRRAVAAAIGLLAAPFLADLALSRLPLDVRSAATAPRATLLGDPVRADALARLHAEWANAGRELSTGGAGALWTRGESLLMEVDGVTADPSTRVAQAERFAGVLASCLTAGRAGARVAGDDLGLVLLSLRAQGFGTIDASAPDRELARGLATAVPVLERGWLAPGVRLLPLSSPAVLRLGPAADAVVEVVRAPWSDATRSLPNRDSLADTRRTLRPGGVHLVALATTATPPAVLTHLLQTFAEVYPSATLWLPPAGADTAILAGRVDDGPIPWAGVETCAAGAGARSLGLGSALDVAGLVLADAGQIRALPPGVPPWFGLPPASPVPGPPPLAELAWRSASPGPLFDAAAPAAEVAARHETLLSFLDLLRSASAGELDRAVASARELATAPGGALALRPLVRPQLDRVRAAMARGEREGLASKAWEEAETALTSARVLAPDLPETRCVEGDLAARRGQLPRAEEAFQACLEGDPGSLVALDGLATVRRLQDDRIGLEKVLREAREAHPEAWTTAHNLGFFLYSLGRWDEAERWLLEGASLNDRTATPSAAPSLALGHLYLDTRRPALALAQGVRAGQIEPGAEASFIRGAARYDLGQFDAADAEFRDALRQDPDHVRARGGLGLVLAQRGEYAAAAEAFKAVLARDPRNNSAAENLRRVQELVGGAAP